MRKAFEERYVLGDTPWDHGAVDRHLMEWVKRAPFEGGRALDVGCGTGENALWLAQQGFEVTGLDLSPTAIRQAQEKASERQLPVAFRCGDFLKESLAGEGYTVAFDRGCFHGVEEAVRQSFAKQVAAGLAAGGHWFLMVGNADEPAREQGPPQMSATELMQAVEPFFEVLSLERGFFDGKPEDPPRAWLIWLQKRG